MFGKLENNKQGFTIIEVVIVLAIAGLIFAVVFLAVPRLQAGQRDSARRSEVANFEAQLTQWQTNNNGSLPGSISETASFVTNYLGDLQDPTTGTYTVTYGTTAPTDVGQITYRDGRVCNAAGTAMATGQARQYAVLYYLEQGGVQCVDNS